MFQTEFFLLVFMKWNVNLFDFQFFFYLPSQHRTRSWTVPLLTSHLSFLPSSHHFSFFSPVQDPEQLTEEEEMKEEKPKMSHINSAITGFEKAFEQFATGGIQSHVTNPVSRPDILKDNKPDVGGFFFLIILVVSICSLYIYIKIHLLN